MILRLFRLLSASVSALPLLLSAQNVNIQGFVSEKATGQTIIGATVLLSSSGASSRTSLGAVTNKDGYYQIPKIAKGNYQIRISAIGYIPFEQKLELDGSKSVVTVSVGLEEDQSLVGELVIEGQRGAAVVEAGFQQIRPEDVSRVPTPDISGDLSSYLQTLPGIVSVGDRGGQLFIRGGTPAENLVLMDGIPITQPFHLIGFYSVFPQDLLSTADVYAGGYGARYSGKTSSVMDITTRDGNNQERRFSVSASPFLGSVQAEGPIKKGSSAYLLSVRNSLIKPIAPVLLNTKVPVQFGEQFLKFSNSDSDTRCSATLLNSFDKGSTDNGNAERNNGLSWQNLLVGGHCVSFPVNQPVLFESSAGLSYFRNTAGNPDNTERSSSLFQVSGDIHLTHFKTAYKRESGFFFRFNGYKYELGGAFQEFSDSKQKNYVSIGGYNEWTLTRPRLEASLGLSITLFPDLSKPSIEPRFRASWFPLGKDKGVTMNMAGGLYTQKTIGLRDERDIGSAFLAWTIAPKDLRVAQFITGLHFPMGKHFQTSVEGYYKKISDQYVPIWSALARFTTALTTAQGEAYGGEMRLEWRQKPFYTYISYAYNSVTYRIRQDNFQEWFGVDEQSYHPPHDQRHQISMVGSYDWRSIRVNARWQYGSGFPFTQAYGFDEVFTPSELPDVRNTNGHTRIIYDRPYNAHLPAYHRLDISVEHERKFQHKTLSLQGGLINGYNRKNLFYFDLYTYQRINQLPIIPYIAAKIEWK
jgi:hypothetical protein